MSWEYNVKFIDEEKPRRFTAEKQLAVGEIQDRFGKSRYSLEWFNGNEMSHDDKESD